MTVGWEYLLGLTGVLPAEVGGGGLLGFGAVRRLACDAQIVPIVLGSEGQPLDVGRASRSVPPAIRRALTARDGGCAFPGCDRPPTWCEAHHVRHWADGGETALSNLVLLCGHHHRRVHHDGWHVGFGDDSHPRFTPPGWVG